MSEGGVRSSPHRLGIGRPPPARGVKIDLCRRALPAAPQHLPAGGKQCPTDQWRHLLRPLVGLTVGGSAKVIPVGGVAPQVPEREGAADNCLCFERFQLCLVPCLPLQHPREVALQREAHDRAPASWAKAHHRLCPVPYSAWFRFREGGWSGENPLRQVCQQGTSDGRGISAAGALEEDQDSQRKARRGPACLLPSRDSFRTGRGRSPREKTHKPSLGPKLVAGGGGSRLSIEDHPIPRGP